MTVEEFVTTLRKYRWQEPPEPFIVELTSGKQILIENPECIGFIEGEAFFFSPKHEIVEFTHKDVQAIRPLLNDAQKSRIPTNTNGGGKGMTIESFHETLRSFLRREPFQPFIVELENGEQIRIDEPTVAFNGRLAGYLSPEYDLIEFRCGDVREMRPVEQGAVS